MLDTQFRAAGRLTLANRPEPEGSSWKAFVEQNQWEAEYLPSAAYVKHLQAEEKRLRAALTDLGLAKQ